jgi:putative membrane protein
VTLADALPSINAVLNAMSGVLLVLGFRAVKARRLELHKKLMLGAFASSAVFLACYLARFFLTGAHRFPGQGALKVAYYAILFSHMVLAAATVPLVFRTLQLSLVQRRFDAHRRIARVTFPVWVYVSVTGVAVYFMLYHLAA